MSSPWALAVPIVCWVMPIPHIRHEPLNGGLGVDSGGFGYLVGRNAGYLLGVVEVVLLDGVPPIVVFLGAVTHEIGVGEALFDYDLGHGVEEGDVCAGTAA